MKNKGEGLFPSNINKIQRLRKKSELLPDTHAECPKVRFYLPSVGLSHLEKWFKTKIAGETGILKVDIEALVDLPSNMRGFNISRHNEVIDEIAANWYDSEKANRLEFLAEMIAQRLLVKHQYSTSSHVSLRTPYPYSHRTPNGLSTQESCEVILKAWAHRKNEEIEISRRGISVTVESALACPLAKAMINEDARYKLTALRLDRKKAENLLKTLPLGTHMERCFSTLELATSGDFTFGINDLIEILENAASTPFFELLKRHDELEVVKKMLRKTRFVEDCVREVVIHVVKLCQNLPDETSVKIDYESLFPLAKYHVIAKIESNLGELEKQLSIS